ncbi:YtxH domain-containing protein [Helicobacter monodelphidis]|uniref:YtxH domain-containing protein n=1 Tax=Helicobacter sp. 15-1451 TaxID=2004995 RepID=UPI0015EC4402|nr:YtxH domain-containing protein [Helicobacter sp. 15-1451]
MNTEQIQSTQNVQQDNQQYSNINQGDYLAFLNATTPHINNPYIQTTNTQQINVAQETNAQNTDSSFIGQFFASSSTQKDMLKGVLIGAVATFILTNEDAQKTIFKFSAKLSSIFEMGVEEMKERYEDAKAEINQGV